VSGSGPYKMKAKLRSAGLIFAFACCVEQQNLVAAAAQEQQPAAAAPSQAAATTKSGGAGGAWSPALTGVRRPLYRLTRSDVVAIHFTFSPEFDQIASVQPDGYITLKGAKQLVAEGITVPELQDAIGHAYAGVLHDPEVTIVLQEFDKPYFIVAGEVNHSGKYELRSDITASEAVAIAGGFTARAKHSQVILFRKVSDDVVESRLLDVKAMMKSRTLGEDIHLQPGDFLFVPQNFMSKIKQYLPTSSLSLYGTPASF
jgi:polysaccharide export outer membrane protein